MKKILRVVNWIVLSACFAVMMIFLLGGEGLNEGSSSLATLLVVLALTGIIWIPIGFVASLLSVILECKTVAAWKELALQPAPYVLVLMSLLLGLMFF